MPVKRRLAKQRRPNDEDPIAALERGEVPEYSPEAMARLLNWYFFSQGVRPPKLERLAAELIDKWHESRHLRSP